MPSSERSSRSLREAGRPSFVLALVLTFGVSPRIQAETAAAASGLTTVDTRSIDLRSPAGGTLTGSPLAVTFHLPRQAVPGSVKMHFDSTVTRTLTLAPEHETAGDHTVSFPPGQPETSAAILIGEALPDGIYTLTLSYQEGAAAPAASNAAAGLIIDQTPPSLSVPADITVPATQPSGAVVTYPAATASDANGIASLTYSNPGGSLFPVGRTTVSVTAQDRAGNITTGTFQVTVEGTQIGVEQPEGTPLVPAPSVPVDFGAVVQGDSRTLIFSIRNPGTVELTGLALSLAPGGTPEDFSAGPLAVTSLAPDALTPFSVTFTPGGDGSRTAQLLIASSDPDENPFAVALAGRRATPLETWRHTHFGSTANTGTGADLNDADSDGLANLVEYATASPPLLSSPSPLSLSVSGDSLHLVCRRPSAAAAELTYTVESSASLAGGWAGTGAAVEVLSEDGTTQQIRFTVPAGPAPRKFLRLRITPL